MAYVPSDTMLLTDRTGDDNIARLNTQTSNATYDTDKRDRPQTQRQDLCKPCGRGAACRLVLQMTRVWGAG